MPVTAASPDDVAALEHTIATQQGEIDDLSEVVEDLRARVTALEQGSTVEPPPDPVDPPPDPIDPPPDPIEPPPPGTMQAVVTVGDHSYAFNEADAEGLGDYFDPGHRFVMTCARATTSLPHFRVDFRRIDGWSCVTFELGSAWGAVPAHMPAYSVDITCDDGSVVHYELPYHWWHARWRHQSGPWPHTTSAAEMAEKGWTPRYDASVNTGEQGPMPAPSYTPMETGGVYPRMADTGGRADIGWCTSWIGEALATDSDQAWANVLVQAEGLNSFPLIERDTTTGAIVDAFIAHPTASHYYPPGGEQLSYGPGRAACNVTFSGPPGTTIKPYANGQPIETHDAANNYFWTRVADAGFQIPDNGSISLVSEGLSGPAIGPLTGGDLPPGCTAEMEPDSWVGACPNSLDTAHMPDAAWAAFLRTGDPYHLETLQAQVVEAFCETPRHVPQCGRDDQGRAVAWSLRTTVEAWHHTPDDVPTWLLSKDVMQEALDQCHAAITAMMEQDNELRSVYSLPSFGLTHGASPPQGSNAAPWQDDFICGAAAWASVLDARFTDYTKYCLEHVCARIDNESGWPGANPTCYTVVYRVNDQYLTSWREAYDATVPYDAGLKDDTEINYTDGAQLDYPQHTYGALALCEQARTKHGVALPDVSAERDRMLAALSDAYSRMPGTRLDWKWCISR